MKTTADSAADSGSRVAGTRVDPPEPARRGRKAFSEIALDRRTWVRLAQNRFWLLIPVLVLDLALVGKLPPPLAPGSAGPDIPGWVSVSEAVLRGVVFGAPLLMPLSLRAPRPRATLVVYTLAFTAYAAAWVVVVWAPISAWSTSAVGFTALAWTSILLFTGIGRQSKLRFFPSYRPWMYLGAAALFTVVHTLNMAIIWNWYYWPKPA